MSFVRSMACAAVIACAAIAAGQSMKREPHIGYLYPAGARRGTTARIVAGGQFLNGPIDVHVSGRGVRASVVRYVRPLFNIQREQRYLLMKRMAETRDKRLREAGLGADALAKIRAQADRALAWAKKQKIQLEGVKFPDHPLLDDLENKTLKDLWHIRHILFFPRQKRQMNRQLAESVLIKVTVDADAPCGDRELRLRTRAGLTNPVVFQVGQYRQVSELEPNDRKGGPDLSRAPLLGKDPKVRKLMERKPIELPVVLNGQIYPGDVDRFCLSAKRGQNLVIATSARRLVPYLADAVPGWFQATVALYDAAGKEVAFADDFRFDPDPVLFYRIPKDGLYELEIRDAIYRGREDFVYRVAIGEQPFITQAFPLGARRGAATVASIEGWNLSARRVRLDTSPGGGWIRHASISQARRVSNVFPYAVDTLPECREAESNDTAANAQRIDMPTIVNGRIAKPGDVDVFRFTGRAGDKVVAEVTARRLNSPLDSLLRLCDASGKVVVWNDDHVTKDKHLHIDRLGLVTHHADSYLAAELPKNGTYTVQISDAQHHGSSAHAYRLRISAPRPDFALRVTPSSLHARPGSIVPVCVYVLRRDGFDGEIEMKVNTPAGFTVTGGRIPAGCDRQRMTLTAPRKGPPGAVALTMEGVAQVNGRTIGRPGRAADNVMQAFLYRHLLPARELTVTVVKQKWGAPPIKIAGDLPVRIPLGGSAQVRVKTWQSKTLKQLVLGLDDPPAGLTLGETTAVADGLEFTLHADKDAAKAGFAGNLIVQAFREYKPKSKDGKVGKKRRWPMGYLPAVPVRVVPN